MSTTLGPANKGTLHPSRFHQHQMCSEAVTAKVGNLYLNAAPPFGSSYSSWAEFGDSWCRNLMRLYQVSNFTKESRAGMSQTEVSEAKKKPGENPCPNLTIAPMKSGCWWFEKWRCCDTDAVEVTVSGWMLPISPIKDEWREPIWHFWGKLYKIVVNRSASPNWGHADRHHAALTLVKCLKRPHLKQAQTIPLTPEVVPVNLAETLWHLPTGSQLTHS